MRIFPKKRYWIPLLLSLAVVSPVRAQSDIEIKPLVDIELDIPFSFTVENSTFPAGRYTIQQSDEDASVLILLSSDRKHEVQFFCQSATALKPSDGTYVDFDVLEGRHYLSAIWTLGSDIGHLVPSGLIQRRHVWRAAGAVKGSERLKAVQRPASGKKHPPR